MNNSFKEQMEVATHLLAGLKLSHSQLNATHLDQVADLATMLIQQADQSSRIATEGNLHLLATPEGQHSYRDALVRSSAQILSCELMKKGSTGSIGVPEVAGAVEEAVGLAARVTVPINNPQYSQDTIGFESFVQQLRRRQSAQAPGDRGAEATAPTRQP